MTGVLGLGEIERFRTIVAQGLGLRFEDARLGLLGDLLQRRIELQREPCGTYLERLAGPGASDELNDIAQELTVSETYFFRHIDQFRAFAEVALPERMRAQSAGKSLRILSAGCASGEEPYSLAMLVREHVDPSWNTSILGVDVNSAILAKAARGRFSSWALRETAADVQRRWFRPDGRDFLLDATIRAAVRFERRNLAAEDPELWRPGAYDVVFCRNVLIYFTPEGIRALVERITSSMAPGAYLFLGHAETLRGLSNDFHLHHTHGTFYYQRRERGTTPAPLAAGARSSPASVAMPLAAVSVEDDTWVEVIRNASDRVRALAIGPQRRPAPKSTRAPGRIGSALGPPLALFRSERFAEALSAVQALPPEAASDPDVLLLRAVLLAHSGELAPAEGLCRQLLGVDHLNSGAHYVLALCSEGAGDRSAAVDHDQTAAYLDPTFAMPHLHLGLLARRDGDRDAARREMRQALALLQREDPSRLLLFGGGFSREALLALCDAELLGSGGTP